MKILYYNLAKEHSHIMVCCKMSRVCGQHLVLGTEYAIFSHYVLQMILTSTNLLAAAIGPFTPVCPGQKMLVLIFKKHKVEYIIARFVTNWIF